MMYSDELYHYGRKGMRWGMHIYQSYSNRSGDRRNRVIAKRNVKASYKNLVAYQKLKDAGKAPDDYDEQHSKALSELSKATEFLGQKKIDKILKSERSKTIVKDVTFSVAKTTVLSVGVLALARKGYNMFKVGSTSYNEVNAALDELYKKR